MQIPLVGDDLAPAISEPVFSRDFVQLEVFPSGVLGIGIALVFMAGAPGEHPSWHTLLGRLNALGSTQLLLGLTGLLVLSILLQAPLASGVEMLRGSWGKSTLAGYGLSVWSIPWRQRHETILNRLDLDLPALVTPKAREGAAKETVLADAVPTCLGKALKRGEVLSEQLMITHPGKIRAETMAAIPYGIRRQLRARRNRWETYERLAVSFAVLSAVTAVILSYAFSRFDSWSLIPIAIMVAAWLSYRAAVASLGSYVRLLLQGIAEVLI
jgi:hypothetical protein